MALSQLPGLKVIGRTSSFQFRDSREDSRSIGAKLHVAHLLEGSVRRSGDLVRISAVLINTEDGSAQWSDRFDRPFKDLFALQDEITRAVAGALRAKLLLSETAAVQSERPPLRGAGRRRVHTHRMQTERVLALSGDRVAKTPVSGLRNPAGRDGCACG